MSRTCSISNKKYNNANRVSHSNHKTKHRQQANLQWKRFWLPEEKRWVRLRVSTKVMKTITKYGLMSTIKRYGADPSLIQG
jgi:large subunit ribosomal protein L28